MHCIARRKIVSFIFLCCAYLPFSASSQSLNFNSSDLPVMIINTGGAAIPDDPKIVAHMGLIYNGTGNRNAITDSMNEYNGTIGIEIHGQSSQMFPMKSYGIELREADGVTSKDVALFGLPAHSDWILYAPYTDKTLMRNFLAYTIAREMGRWASNCRYVELILNGEYVGIYVLEEQIRRDKNRVNISKLKTSDTTGDNITGGYIIRIDKDYTGFYSNYTPQGAPQSRILFNYYYPKEADILPKQTAYIASYIDSFETALAAKPFADTVTGYRHYADVNSFIDYFIVNELSRNVDGYRLSTYLYKDKFSKGGKLVAGPVWDYDLAFRNADYCQGSDTSGWAYAFNGVCPGDSWFVPFWWNSLLSDTVFTAALRCRWKSLRTGSLSETRLYTLIDSVVSLTAEARTRHFAQWPVLGEYVWPNPQPLATNYPEEISYLKQWIHDRLNWIDKHIPNNGACSDYPDDAPMSFAVKQYPVPMTRQVTLEINSRNSQVINLLVTGADGKSYFTKQFAAVKGKTTFTMQTEILPAGVYLLRFYNEAGEHLMLKTIKSNY